STRLNSSHVEISYAVFCLKKVQTCARSEEHTSELQARRDLVCGLLLEKKRRLLRHHRIVLGNAGPPRQSPRCRPRTLRRSSCPNPFFKHPAPTGAYTFSLRRFPPI